MTGPSRAELERGASRFGATALSRTHLADARLSEDIDLIARISRG